jgi:GxxExxY protein
MKNDPRTHAIIGAAMEVHRIIGPGHLEAVYHECLEIEFKIRNIPFISKPKLEIYYKEEKLKRFYVPDFMVYNDIVLEIKSDRTLTKLDEAQIINSLKISRHETGLLINFGEISLNFRRYINSIKKSV